MTCATTLTIAGGVLELLGVGLVLLEVTGDRKRARDLLATDPPKMREPLKLGEIPPLPQEPISTTYEDLASSREREAKVVRQQAEAMKAIVEIGDDRLAKTQHHIEEAIYADRENVRKNLEEILAGNIPGRIAGALLLVAGIAATTVGQLVA